MESPEQPTPPTEDRPPSTDTPELHDGPASRIRSAGASAGEIVAWLAAVLALIKDYPRSVVAGCVAIGLAVAIARHLRPRGWRLVAVAGFIVLGWAVAAFLPAALDGGGTPAHAAEVRPVSIIDGLRASLEVKNQSFRKRWGAVIAADGEDELLFRMRVTNPTASPSQPVVMRILSDDEATPRTVDICFSGSETGEFSEGPAVEVIPQSRALAHFHVSTPRLGRQSPSATELTSLSDQTYRTDERTYEAHDYVVPAISAHESIVVTFEAGYWAPNSGELAGGPVVEFKNLTNRETEWERVVAAKPGDAVRVSGQLFNTGWMSISSHVNVRLEEHDGGSFVWVVLMASDGSGAPEHELGHGVVNAEGRAHIGLQVIPGTTEFARPKTACSQETREAVPDGLTEGGVEVKGIGGFEPRDPCGGAEFSGYLLFKAKVDRAR